MKTPRQFDTSRSGTLFNIMKVAVYSRYDRAMVMAVAQLWCKTHAPDYDLRRLETTYNKVLRRYQEEPPAEQSASMPGGEGEGCDNAQVYNHPPTSPPCRRPDQLMGQSLPVPKRPAASKQTAFNDEEQARASLAGLRTDFEKKYFDDPEVGEWQRTRCYLMGVAYYAFKAGCNEAEALWYLVQFIREQAADFWLTPKRLKTIFRFAKARLKSVLAMPARRRKAAALGQGLQAKKPRKTRSDKGTSKRLRQVARLMEKGLGPAKIAAKLGIKRDTVKGYRAEIRLRGGTDLVLRPKKRRKLVPSFDSPLAQFLYDAFEQDGRPIPSKRAAAVFSETMSYADRLGYPEFFNERLIQSAVTGVSESPTRKRIVHFFKLAIADLAYPQENPAVKLLCDLIQRERLPSDRVYQGEKQRNKYGFAMALLCAKLALTRYWSLMRRSSDPSVDVDMIWEYSEAHGGLWKGLKQLRRELQDLMNNPAEYELSVAA